MPTTRVLSNTTPLINLAGVDLLDLLPRLYGEVSIARQVYDEFQRKRQPHEPDLDTLPWLHVVDIAPADFDPAVQPLDAGEAATISLAVALQADLVILDEAAGRDIATQLGLSMTGSLGILLLAKAAGMITAIAPVLQAMQQQGRHLSPTLIAAILHQAGE